MPFTATVPRLRVDLVAVLSAVYPVFAFATDVAFFFADAMYLSITGPTYAPLVLTTERVMPFVSALVMPESVTDPPDEVAMKALPAFDTASMR